MKQTAATAPVVETLENRQLMSVSLDANGWTVVTPTADSRVIYVSSSTGNDVTANSMFLNFSRASTHLPCRA